MTAATHPSPSISFEFFPPRNPMAGMALWQSVERLAPLRPRFVSVTYGAGGSTRERTMAAILAIRDRAGLEVAGHLTCVGAPRREVMKVARSYAKLGCRRIVALRGDPPGDATGFTPHPEGFASSVELIESLAEMDRFEIWAACYPEKHPDAANTKADIDHLKRKLDAGAAGAITQFFFENETFYRFRDACAAAGITKPILPGIMPVENFERLKVFAGRCAASIPTWMHHAYRNAETKEEHDLLSVCIAAEQSHDLLENDVEHLHVYTLNRPEVPFNLCRALGVQPAQVALAASCG